MTDRILFLESVLESVKQGDFERAKFIISSQPTLSSEFPMIRKLVSNKMQIPLMEETCSFLSGVINSLNSIVYISGNYRMPREGNQKVISELESLNKYLFMLIENKNLLYRFLIDKLSSLSDLDINAYPERNMDEEYLSVLKEYIDGFITASSYFENILAGFLDETYSVESFFPKDIINYLNHTKDSAEYLFEKTKNIMEKIFAQKNIDMVFAIPQKAEIHDNNTPHFDESIDALYSENYAYSIPKNFSADPCAKNTANEEYHDNRNYGESGLPKRFYNSIGMAFVLIPSGSFFMGSREGLGHEANSYKNGTEFPKHQVDVKRFYMGIYPVTQAQWKYVMGDEPGFFRGPEKPVESISFKDCCEFIEHLNQMENTRGYRLPSEAEWEYSCRAGTDTEYYFGNDVRLLDNFAWHSGNAYYLGPDKKRMPEHKNFGTHSPGAKKPNNFGLYDMHGNVWEWCYDIWHRNYKGAPSYSSPWTEIDNRAEKDRRAIRGGSWKNGSCRSASRGSFPESKNDKTIGIRIVYDPDNC